MLGIRMVAFMKNQAGASALVTAPGAADVDPERDAPGALKQLGSLLLKVVYETMCNIDLAISPWSQGRVAASGLGLAPG